MSEPLDDVFVGGNAIRYNASAAIFSRSWCIVRDFFATALIMWVEAIDLAGDDIGVGLNHPSPAGRARPAPLLHWIYYVYPARS